MDDVVREQSSNESTLAEAQTCPEFRSRNDALSSSSASISGSATASATQSELCLGTDPELMHTLQSLPNTLQTLSPLCSLRYQVAEVPASEADFTDVVPPNTMPMTLELWPDQLSHEAQLLSALQAMPNVSNAPFGHLLNASNAQSPLSPPPRIHDALGANLSAMAAVTAFPSVMPMPNVPSVPWAPPVLSTIPPANEFLAQVSCQIVCLPAMEVLYGFVSLVLGCPCKAENVIGRGKAMESLLIIGLLAELSFACIDRL